MSNLLIIHPKLPPADSPVNDSITRKMAAALIHPNTKTGMMRGETFVANTGMQGLISCCDKTDPEPDKTYLLPNGFLTTCFALHWLQYHREEIPANILQQIDNFNYGEQPANISF